MNGSENRKMEQGEELASAMWLSGFCFKQRLRAGFMDKVCGGQGLTRGKCHGHL